MWNENGKVPVPRNKGVDATAARRTSTTAEKPEQLSLNSAFFFSKHESHLPIFALLIQ